MKGATPSGPSVSITMSATARHAACAATAAAGSRRRRVAAPGRTYCPPIPTAIASTTEVVTSGEASPRREQPLDHLARACERVGAEEDPGEADDVERDDAPDPAAQRRVGGRQPRASPVAEAARPRARCRGSRPRRRTSTRRRARGRRGASSASGCGSQQPPLPAAAERDVEVVAKPARQRHVPAAPEVLQ